MVAYVSIMIASEIANLEKEAYALKNLKKDMESPNFIEEIFDQVFHDDIMRLKSIEDLWKLRKAPTPLSYNETKRISSPDRTKKSDHHDVQHLKDNFEIFCSR